MCEYEFRNGERCKEEALPNSKYCILHIDLPEDEEGEEFKRINKLKEEKVIEKENKGDFNFEGVKLFEFFFYHTKKVEGGVNFADTVIRSGWFWFKGAIIEGKASFEGATIEAPLFFNKATIKGDAIFEGVTIEAPLEFRSATIKGDAMFNRAIIKSSAWFEGAVIEGEASFEGATIVGGVWFKGATIKGSTPLDGFIKKNQLCLKEQH